jgi:hypothetical protein
MDIYERLNGQELMVPNVTTVVLSAVVPSRDKPHVSLCLFSHPDDVSSGVQKYQNVGLVYAPNAQLPPQKVKLSNGETRSMSFNIGGLHLTSFLQAAGATDSEIEAIFTANRDDRMDMIKCFVGVAVDCPMTGRVKDDKGVTRIQFKFDKLDDAAFADFSGFVKAQKNVFTAPEDKTLGDTLSKEAARTRLTRPEESVTPVGVQEGDELMA